MSESCVRRKTGARTVRLGCVEGGCRPQHTRRTDRLPYRLLIHGDLIPVYGPAFEDRLDRLVDQPVVLVGKLVDLSSEGFGRELGSALSAESSFRRRDQIQRRTRAQVGVDLDGIKRWKTINSQ